MERVACELQYSGPARAFLAGGVAAVVAVAFALPLPAEGRVAFIAWAGAMASFAAARLEGRRTLVVKHDGRVEVGDADGWREGRLRPGSFVAPWLVIVRWRPDGVRLDRTVLVLPGMVAGETFRALRVVLKWGACQP